MLLGFKTELKVNITQRILLAKHAGTARHAYNWGLALCQKLLKHNRENPDEPLKFPTAIDLHKLLVALVKPTYNWYYEVSKCAPQYALRQLRQAFADFFKKKRINGKPVGFPRFKKKSRHNSFTLDGSIKVVDHFKIQVPVIGVLKTYERLPKGFLPKNVTISRQADRWFISFKVETEPQATEKISQAVGVDLGVKNLATLSTGEVIEGAKSYRKLEQKLRRLQRNVSRKKLKSNNWYKAQLKVARLHRRIANLRKDTLHKLTTNLAKNHGQIVIEDLNVSGMMANRKLSKAIADMGLFEFRRQLDYKCQLYGAELIVADRFFPSSKTCSACGQVKKTLTLSERTFNCECGFSCDRDLNASYNLVRIADAEFTPVDRVRPTVLGEAGTKKKIDFPQEYVQLCLPLSNIV
ncbi:MAG: RNA-guided endonuclease TnpB family protein [Prochloraceae cyanobacterium]|nr:RNA-guided endonuclease TnpB family protein [Prochloraceae cyanobacterium]